MEYEFSIMNIVLGALSGYALLLLTPLLGRH